MKLTILAEELERAGIGSQGKDLFVFHMPAEVNEGVMIRLPLIGVPVDHELPGYHKTPLQAIVRTRSVAAGEEKAAAIISALTMKNVSLIDANTGVEGMFVNYIRAETLPVVYPRSDGNALEWSINFDCCYVLP